MSSRSGRLKLRDPFAYPPYMTGVSKEEIEADLHSFLKPVMPADLLLYKNDERGMLFVELVGTELLYRVTLEGVDRDAYVFASVPKGVELQTQIASANDVDTYKWFVGKREAPPPRYETTGGGYDEHGDTEDMFRMYDHIERAEALRRKQEQKRVDKQRRLDAAGMKRVQVTVITSDGYDELVVVEVPVDASAGTIDRAVQARVPTAVRVGDPSLNMFLA